MSRIMKCTHECPCIVVLATSAGTNVVPHPFERYFGLFQQSGMPACGRAVDQGMKIVLQGRDLALLPVPFSLLASQNLSSRPSLWLICSQSTSDRLYHQRSD